MWPDTAWRPFRALVSIPPPDPAILQTWLMVTSAVAAYLGEQHLWLWLGRRQEKLHLLIAAFGFDACVFALAHAALNGWTDDPHLEIILGRILVVSGVLVASLFVITSPIVAAAHIGGVLLTTSHGPSRLRSPVCGAPGKHRVLNNGN